MNPQRHICSDNYIHLHVRCESSSHEITAVPVVIDPDKVAYLLADPTDLGETVLIHIDGETLRVFPSEGVEHLGGAGEHTLLEEIHCAVEIARKAKNDIKMDRFGHEIGLAIGANHL